MIFLKDEEKRIYEDELAREKEKIKIRRDEKRKKKILQLARKNARPIKDKIKDGLKYLKRIKIDTEYYGDDKK